MNLLVIDDHVVVLEGFTALLRGSSLPPDVLVARGISAALVLADAHPDLDAAPLDLMMPNPTGWRPCGRRPGSLLGQPTP